MQVIAFVDSSPHLDGAFFDISDNFAHAFAAAALQNSTVTTQYQQCALAFAVTLIERMSAVGKIPIVSTKTYLGQYPKWEAALEQAHQRHGGMVSVRFRVSVRARIRA